MPIHCSRADQLGFGLKHCVRFAACHDLQPMLIHSGLQWLHVKETDDEKTKNRKKKLQKSFKSKLRFQQLDMEVKNRQTSWLNFKKGKGSKKKVRLNKVSPVC